MNDEILGPSDNSSAAHTLPVPKFILETPKNQKRPTSERQYFCKPYSECKANKVTKEKFWNTNTSTNRKEKV